MFTHIGNTQASMLLGDFKYNLNKLNPNLYISNGAVRREGLYHSGIYLRGMRQRGLAADTKGKADAKIEKYYRALEAGELDKFICGLCIEWLPEFDIYNAEYTSRSVPGWRTLLMRLVQSKAIDLDKARKVFNCYSLGESDYDKLSFFGKLEFAKKLDGVK